MYGGYEHWVEAPIAGALIIKKKDTRTKDVTLWSEDGNTNFSICFGGKQIYHIENTQGKLIKVGTYT